MSNILISAVFRRGLLPVATLRNGQTFLRPLSTSGALHHSPDEDQGIKSAPASQQSKCQTTNAIPEDKNMRKATTPVGRLDDKWEGKREKAEPQGPAAETDVYKPFPGSKNPVTGEIGGPRGPEPTRYGDWERKGRVIDF